MQAQRGPASRARNTAESQRKQAEALNRARAEAKKLGEKQKHVAEAGKLLVIAAGPAPAVERSTSSGRRSR